MALRDVHLAVGLEGGMNVGMAALLEFIKTHNIDQSSSVVGISPFMLIVLSDPD